MKKLLLNMSMFLIGITLGVLFYPSKKIEERLERKFDQELVSQLSIHKEEKVLLEEEIQKRERSLKQIEENYRLNLNSLTMQVKELQSNQKTSFFKLVKPDGTIEIKKFTESEVNESTQVIRSIQLEFEQKIQSIEKKWEDAHRKRVQEIKKDFDLKEENYKKQIEQLKKEKITSINEKRFGLEFGIDSDKRYYGHIAADLWGPIFLGFHSSISKVNTNLGAGVGVRF